jgi:Fic family protein
LTVYKNILLRDSELTSTDKIFPDALLYAHHKMFSDEYDDAGTFRATQLFSYPKATVQGTPLVYNPPNPEELKTSIKDLGSYINSTCKYDPLIQIALAYYQLATIRPFSIGNGLTERLCISLLLARTGLISRPLLCFSECLLGNDAEFRGALRFVRDYGYGYETWVKYFLKVLNTSAEQIEKILDNLYKLRMSDLKKLRNNKKCSQLMLALYEYLWQSPIIEAREMTSTFDVSYNTVAKAMNSLCVLGILHQMDSKTRYRRFGYKEMLRILNGT